MQKIRDRAYFTVIIAILTSCAAPKAITNSRKATPHKQLRFGSNFLEDMI